MHAFMDESGHQRSQTKRGKDLFSDQKDTAVRAHTEEVHEAVRQAIKSSNKSLSALLTEQGQSEDAILDARSLEKLLSNIGVVLKKGDVMFLLNRVRSGLSEDGERVLQFRDLLD